MVPVNSLINRLCLPYSSYSSRALPFFFSFLPHIQRSRHNNSTNQLTFHLSHLSGQTPRPIAHLPHFHPSVMGAPHLFLRFSHPWAPPTSVPMQTLVSVLGPHRQALTFLLMSPILGYLPSRLLVPPLVPPCRME